MTQPFNTFLNIQITDLILHDNDEYLYTPSPVVRTRNVYSDIFAIFENIKHLTIVSSSMNDYPPLSVYHHQLTTYFASTLTVLCVTVYNIHDCLSLLDGRLKQLTMLNVQIAYVIGSSLPTVNIVSRYYFTIVLS